MLSSFSDKNNKDLNIIEFEDSGNERALLASIVNIPNSVVEIFDTLKETDFITPHNKYLFHILCRLYIENKVTTYDITTVVNKATVLELLDKCGGFDYINSIFNTTVLKENIQVFIAAILENSSKKLLYDKLTVVREEVLKNVSGKNILTSSDLISLAENNITDVLTHSSRVDEAENLSSGIDLYIEQLMKKEAGTVGIPTGFVTLDGRINGLTPGSLTILAARPKTGKSILLMEMALQVCLNNKIPVLYVDTEMSTNEIRTRSLSHLSGVRERSIVNGEFAENEEFFNRVVLASKTLKEGCFYHKYIPGATVDKVVSLARKYKIQKDIGVVFFDYIKLPDGADLKNVKENQLLGYTAASLKDLAGSLNIPVVTAAQIGRAGAGKSYLRSDMIADSDRLLRYCNNMLGLCKKDAEELEKARKSMSPQEFRRYLETNGTHRLQVLETRGGGTLFEGVNLTFWGSIITFRESLMQPHTGQTVSDDPFEL